MEALKVRNLGSFLPTGTLVARWGRHIESVRRGLPRNVAARGDVVAVVFGLAACAVAAAAPVLQRFGDLVIVATA